MIKSLKQLAATYHQRRVLVKGLMTALNERLTNLKNWSADDLAEAHIGHLKADIAELDRQIAEFRASLTKRKKIAAVLAAKKAKLEVGKITLPGRMRLQRTLAPPTVMSRPRKLLAGAQKPRVRDRA